MENRRTPLTVKTIQPLIHALQQQQPTEFRVASRRGESSMKALLQHDPSARTVTVSRPQTGLRPRDNTNMLKMEVTPEKKAVEKTALITAQQEVKELQEKLYVLNAEKQEVSIQLGNTTALVAERDAKIASLEAAATKLADDKAHLARQEAKLSDLLSAERQRFTRMEHDLSTAQQQIAALNEQLANYKAECNSLRQSSQKDIQSLTSANKNLQKENEHLKGQLAEARQAEAVGKAAAQELKEEVTRFRDAAEKTKRDLASAINRYHEAEQSRKRRSQEFHREQDTRIKLQLEKREEQRYQADVQRCLKKEIHDQTAQLGRQSQLRLHAEQNLQMEQASRMATMDELAATKAMMQPQPQQQQQQQSVCSEIVMPTSEETYDRTATPSAEEVPATETAEAAPMTEEPAVEEVAAAEAVVLEPVQEEAEAMREVEAAGGAVEADYY